MNKLKLSYLTLQLDCKFIKCFKSFKMNYAIGVEPTTTTISKKLNMKSSKSYVTSNCWKEITDYFKMSFNLSSKLQICQNTVSQRK